MKKYFLNIHPEHVYFGETGVREPHFLIEVAIDSGSVHSAKLSYRNYTTQLSETSISLLNNKKYYNREGNNLKEIFSAYSDEHNFTATVEEHICRFCAYLLFFNFMTSDHFLSLVPVYTKLPFEKFSSLIKQSSFPLITFLLSTITKVSLETSLLQYTILMQNFLNMFDIIFKEGLPLDPLDVATFTIGVNVDVCRELTARMVKSSEKYIAQRLLEEHQLSNATISERSLPEELSSVEETVYGSWVFK